MSNIDQALINALAARYRLERELGAGGMATVYLADDLRHERKVAVKVLRPELSAALGPERFHREITTTANLRHPNILPLYDSGESAGFLYYVMPFIEGETLRHRLDREQQLPVADALRLTAEIADALGYAHARGVIHRDIKPENILLEDGHAVVADFGIAQAVSASSNTRLTMVGMSLGTPLYMSPEQASGESSDARSDLYSLGCMTYEMFAGQPPFTGPTPIAVMIRHATEPVPLLTAARPGISQVVSELVARALAKNPDDRFATIGEWKDLLLRSFGATDAGTNTTVASSAGAPAISKPAPVPATALLGRDAALDTAYARIRAGSRLLTITGTGGTGKTRFAIALFDRVQHEYAGGAAFISVASVSAANQVMPTVVAALNIADAGGRSAVEAITTYIGERRVLLLLDNLEQVLDVAGDVATLVARCPALQVVATSRAPLKIGAEFEMLLPMLELPPVDANVDAITQSSAVMLFAQRAAKVKPGFAITAANAKSVAAICRRLDGLPLALELAAARIRILEPAALLERLHHALDILVSGDRDLAERHRTLRAAVNWSYSLLDAREQRLLRRTSVFDEGWTFDAMEAVCYDETERYRALDELDSLVEKGLVQVTGDGARYRLLETIREFGAELLAKSGEGAAVRGAHADFFLDFVRLVNDGIVGTGQLDAMRRAADDNANTLSAIRWLSERASAGEASALEKGLLMAGYLNWVWHIRGQHSTARALLDPLLALSVHHAPTLGRALAQMTAGLVSVSIDDGSRADDEWRRGMEDARVVGDPHALMMGALCVGYGKLVMGEVEAANIAFDEGVATAKAANHDFFFALISGLKGMLLGVTGDIPTGLAMLENAIAIQARIQDYEGAGMCKSCIAQLVFSTGDGVGALGYYASSLRAFETVGDIPELARLYCEMGWTALSIPDVAEARRTFRESLRVYNEVGSQRGVGLALMGLATAEAAEGHDENAVIIGAAADVLSERTGIVIRHAMSPSGSDRVGEIRRALPKAQLDVLVARGGAMSVPEVLAMIER